MNLDSSDYVIATCQVDPDQLEKLDTRNSSRDKDGVTIRLPSQTNPCPIQLWEVYFAVAVLAMQPPSSVLTAHVRALCEHKEEQYLCEVILPEFLVGLTHEGSQTISLYSFFEEYINRKLNIKFLKGSLLKYLRDVLDDLLCTKCRIPRSYVLFPFVQAFLLNTPFFDFQYDEMIDAMFMYNLPIVDILADPDADFGDAVGIDWEAVKLYDDPKLVLKKHGGWAVTKGHRMVTAKDQLMMRLTGLSLQQILQNQGIPDSPRIAQARAEDAVVRTNQKSLVVDASFDDDSQGSSHPSDFDVEPEHPKVMPFGVTLCEAYCLLRGLLVGIWMGMPGCAVRNSFWSASKDGHLLAAAVIIDLYMREQIDIHHWTLNGGNVAVPYRCQVKAGICPLDHFLDEYKSKIEQTFRDMRLQPSVGDYPIWFNLEARGVIDNRRRGRQRFCVLGLRSVEIWDFVRPDLLLDIKTGYLTGARMLYDKTVADPFEDAPNDQLMFIYALQSLFDSSFGAWDGMTRVLSELCPPFHKGELFAPLNMVHAGAVCDGLINRAVRVARRYINDIAMEAAEYNEQIMNSFERKFFLQENLWESFDIDGSGELTLDEFIEGWENSDLYMSLRKERIPEAVLKLIIRDFAERLFSELDVDGSGTISADEIGNAFKLRAAQAKKAQEAQQYLKNFGNAMLRQLGGKKDENGVRAQALRNKAAAEDDARRTEALREREWASEVDRAHIADEDFDVNPPMPFGDQW